VRFFLRRQNPVAGSNTIYIEGSYSLSRRSDFELVVEPKLIKIVTFSPSINDEKIAYIPNHEEWVVPNISEIVCSLRAVSIEGRQTFKGWLVTGERYNDKPLAGLKWDKGLRPQRVALQHPNDNWWGLGLSSEYAHQRAIASYINRGEIMESRGSACIDGNCL
jgi:hypothetical protein